MMNPTLLSKTLVALAVLVSVVMLERPAPAKERKPKPGDQAQVVAHLAFDGLSPVDMTIQKTTGDKYYLYVQHAGSEGISVVDVGKPAQAKVLGLTPWPEPSMNGRMNLAGNLAIVAESETSTARNHLANDELVLWDLSNPAEPRVIQKFSGVVKWIEDERSFVYVLNADGLWIVSEPVVQKTDSNSDYNGG